MGNIIKHVRDKKHRYVATFVAVPDIDGKSVNIGWAKCHRLDKEKNRVNKVSSKKKGLAIAIARVESGSKKPIAFTLVNEMLRFIERISRYYKDKNVIAPAGVIQMEEYYKDKNLIAPAGVIQMEE